MHSLKRVPAARCYVRAFSTPKPDPNALKRAPVIDFSDPRAAFQSKSFGELVRGQIVFRACLIKPLVQNSEKMLKLSYKYLGASITDAVLRATFFGHFCAGTNEKTIKPTVDKFYNVGVGSIFDYAAENDVDEADNGKAKPKLGPDGKPKPRVYNQGRTYEYVNEDDCDDHVETFISCINAVRNVSPTGFAAIKITALGDPELLRRSSVALVELKKLFRKLDTNNTGFVTKEDFMKTFHKEVDGLSASALFDSIDVDKDNKINYIEWSDGLKLEDLHQLTSHCSVQGPLTNATLDVEERKLYKKMQDRIDTLATLAKENGVRLMIDAEHTYFQPAIDNITVDLARRFNRPGGIPVIFSTYQMYLKDSAERLFHDIERAKKGGYKFAAKLVRGAYMILERSHAAAHKLDDPINEDKQTTHINYNTNMRKVIQKISEGEDIEIMCASHNQRSVELVLEAMEDFNLKPGAGIYFGQLMGMMDHLTFNLGAKGYKAYKYVPYGEVREVMPYLIRRAQENSDPFGGAKLEIEMLNAEMKRRIFG